jgi:hypothetical protein
MAMTQLETSWSLEDLFKRAIGLFSDDRDWFVQTRSGGTLLLKRERAMGPKRWFWFAAILLFVVLTLGLALLIFPTLFINHTSQYVSMSAEEHGGKTKATINYTIGARKRVKTLVGLAPR